MKLARGLLVAIAVLAGACSRTGLSGRASADGGVVVAAATGGTGGGGSAGSSTAGGGSTGGSTAVGTGGTTQVASTTGTGGARTDAAPVGTTVDCFIATRTDTCCPYPFVISRNEMDEDPCVQPYEHPTYLPECLAKRPSSCLTMDCAYVTPLSRVVGRGPSGTCQYLTECESDDDCLWVIDVRDCCGCPAHYPRALVAADPCLQDPYNRSDANCTNPLCASVRCDKPDAYCPPRVSVACTASAAQAAAGLKGCVESVP